MIKSSTDWLSCTLTKARLGVINSIIEENVNTSDLGFKQLVLHTLKQGGKKLRPSLYLLSINTGEYYEKHLLMPAAALELIHIASLYHDDVMDQTDQRRNSPSANALWGNVNAVNSGNYLFSKAITLLSKYDANVNQITCHFISELCLGQLKEAENSYNLILQQDDHIDIIKKKSASLFELPCLLGTLLSKASTDTVEALVNYGKNIGIAFQLIDDILDLNGNPNKTGKKIGTDLREGIYGYATLHALNSGSSSKELSDILSIEKLTETHIIKAIGLIKKSGGIELAKIKAKDYVDEAINSISYLPETPTKNSLLNLANYIISRDN